ncbi:MAG: hypothetical protein ACYDAL_05735 [Candidatus Dormibacteraceae bacterium]
MADAPLRSRLTNGNPWVASHNAQYTTWWVEMQAFCRILVRCRKKGTFDLPAPTRRHLKIKPPPREGAPVRRDEKKAAPIPPKKKITGKMRIT